MNEPPPPLPPVVIPTSGTENSINFTAPNLTPETVGHYCKILTIFMITIFCMELVYSSLTTEVQRSYIWNYQCILCRTNMRCIVFQQK